MQDMITPAEVTPNPSMMLELLESALSVGMKSRSRVDRSHSDMSKKSRHLFRGVFHLKHELTVGVTLKRKRKFKDKRTETDLDVTILIQHVTL